MASSSNDYEQTGPSNAAQRDKSITPISPTNGTSQTQGEEEEDTPELSAVLPAIFVPLEQDHLRPIEPPKDRVELLQRMQVSLDATEKAVRDNLAWMFEREARRRLAEAKKTLPLSVPHEPKDIAWDEADMLLANMAAPAVPNHTYHLPLAKLEEFKAVPINTGPEQLPAHEKTAHDLLMVVHNGSRDIEGYSRFHIKEIRDRLNQSLERESQGDADFDMHMS